MNGLHSDKYLYILVTNTWRSSVCVIQTQVKWATS